MPVDQVRPLPARRHRLFWWKEVLIVLGFYLVYSWIRNQFGSNAFEPGGIPFHAFDNAERVIRLETLIGLYHEQAIQHAFLPYRFFIQFWNTWYGTAHFIVTLVVIVLLFRKRPAVYPVWRNALAIMTAMAIIGFALFPLMPPRLLDKPCDDYGGACIPSTLRSDDNTFGYVDTLSVYGGPWSFDSDKMADVSNQYAAMPSMHIGWSTWCAVAMWPLLRRRWQRAVVFLYPLATLFCIIVTANHYWLDGLGGLLCFAVGTLAGWGLHRWNQSRLDRRHLASLGATEPADQASVTTGNNPAA
jgi:cytochrome bd-type quinol oxidase subunit 2